MHFHSPRPIWLQPLLSVQPVNSKPTLSPQYIALFSRRSCQLIKQYYFHYGRDSTPFSLEYTLTLDTDLLSLPEPPFIALRHVLLSWYISFQCCITNYHKLIDLKQRTFIISQFPWVKTVGIAYLGSLMSLRLPSAVRLCSHLEAALRKNLLLNL